MFHAKNVFDGSCFLSFYRCRQAFLSFLWIELKSWRRSSHCLIFYLYNTKVFHLIFPTILLAGFNAPYKKCIWWELFSHILQMQASISHLSMNGIKELMTFQSLINFYLYNTKVFHLIFPTMLLAGFNVPCKKGIWWELISLILQVQANISHLFMNRIKELMTFQSLINFLFA